MSNIRVERKHRKSRWEKKLLEVVEGLEEKGHPVRFVTSKVLHDYGGMNYAAAKRMRFPWPKGFSKKGYLIDAAMAPKRQAKDLTHEDSEFIDMTEGRMEYWPAHLRALQAEKAVRL